MTDNKSVGIKVGNTTIYKEYKGHILLTGAHGTGKTRAIKEILVGVRNKGKKGLIYDPNGEFVKSSYRNGDIVIESDDINDYTSSTLCSWAEDAKTNSCVFLLGKGAKFNRLLNTLFVDIQQPGHDLWIILDDFLSLSDKEDFDTQRFSSAFVEGRICGIKFVLSVFDHDHAQGPARYDKDHFGVVYDFSNIHFIFRSDDFKTAKELSGELPHKRNLNGEIIPLVPLTEIMTLPDLTGYLIQRDCNGRKVETFVLDANKAI